MKYKAGDFCKKHEDVQVKKTPKYRLGLEDGHYMWGYDTKHSAEFYCPECSRIAKQRHLEINTRHEQGPENSRIKGDRLRIKNHSVNEIRKALKGVSGIKKIRLGDGCVEVINTWNHGIPLSVLKSLEDLGIKIWMGF